MSLTIKQAFEALSDACANGMKNPFFVMRRLKESFADVASKVVDAQGDKVTVTQTLTTGTEIGSVKVNNTTTKLYAPEGGGGNNYSTSETKVGKWIDGSDIYAKTFTNITLPKDSYTATIDVGIKCTVLKVECLSILAPSNVTYPSIYTQVDNSGDTTIVHPTNSLANLSGASICVYYVK